MSAAVALVAATATPLVAAAQTPAPASGESAAPASQAETVTALSDRVTRATAAVAAVQKQQADVAAQTQADDADIARIQASVGTLQRTSSEAVAAARQEALASYMHSDTADQALALATAVSQGDVNDVAWSLGLLKVTHDHSVAVLKSATSAAGTANQQLTGALAARGQLAGQADHLVAALAQAQADLATAQTDLATTVKQLGSTVADGMTTVAYDAYQQAAAEVATEMPTCGLRWELLSAIGKTESNHGGGRLDAKGDSVIPIIGIPIGADTDGGVLDLDPTADHAVGPMQFIPSTWRTSGADGNGDGVADPNNVFDEALAAARYLCRAAGSLTLLTRDGVVRAILSYNPNLEYLQVVGRTLRGTGVRRGPGLVQPRRPARADRPRGARRQRRRRPRPLRRGVHPARHRRPDADGLRPQRPRPRRAAATSSPPPAPRPAPCSPAGPASCAAPPRRRVPCSTRAPSRRRTRPSWPASPTPSSRCGWCGPPRRSRS